LTPLSVTRPDASPHAEVTVGRAAGEERTPWVPLPEALPFRDGVDAIGGDVGEAVDVAAGPADLDLACPRRAAQGEVGAEVIGGAVAVGGADLIAHGASVGGDVDAGSNAVPVALAAPQAELQPVTAVAALIDEQRGGAFVRDEQDIDVAVVVD